MTAPIVSLRQTVGKDATVLALAKRYLEMEKNDEDNDLVVFEAEDHIIEQYEVSDCWAFDAFMCVVGNLENE